MEVSCIICYLKKEKATLFERIQDLWAAEVNPSLALIKETWKVWYFEKEMLNLVNTLTTEC